MVTDDSSLLEYVKKHIRKEGFIGQELDYEPEGYGTNVLTEEMLNDPNLLGELIDENDMFNDLKLELKWAYGSAYNQKASDNVYIAAIDSIIDIFGKGEWVQKKSQRGYDIQLLKFEVTNLVLKSVESMIENCWSGCRRYFKPEDHYDSEEHESEEQAFEEYCEECIDVPFNEYGNFLHFYAYYVHNETNETLSPGYDEWPSSEEIEEYFKEDVYNRI